MPTQFVWNAISSLEDVAIPVAWWVALLCVLFSARIATGFLTHNPIMFTVMALFACAWTHVLGFYGAQLAMKTATRSFHDQLETLALSDDVARQIEQLPNMLAQPFAELSSLIATLAALLFVYIGALLVLEATADDRKRDHPLHVAALQILALVFLLFVAAPRAIDVVLPNQQKLFGFTAEQAKYLVSAGLDILGLIFIAIGAWRISTIISYLILLTIVVVYGSLETEYDIRCVWNECQKSDVMLAEYALFFSILKIAFTVSFGAIVARHGMPRSFRDRGLGYCILHFWGLAPSLVTNHSVDHTPIIP